MFYARHIRMRCKRTRKRRIILQLSLINLLLQFLAAHFARSHHLCVLMSINDRYITLCRYSSSNAFRGRLDLTFFLLAFRQCSATDTHLIAHFCFVSNNLWVSLSDSWNNFSIWVLLCATPNEIKNKKTNIFFYRMRFCFISVKAGQTNTQHI